MNKSEVYRSPFFYVGDKYKLVPQLIRLFPNDISTYIEPFVGGGSSLTNINAKKYIANDIDEYVIKLHKAIGAYSGAPLLLLNELFFLIDKYGLSCSYIGRSSPDELKKKYVKTYYAQYNKESYQKMRNDYNNNQSDMLLLYLLLIYGFNHMIRFNSAGKFNLPVGNVDFNRNVCSALLGYLDFMENNSVEFHNEDFKDFLAHIAFDSRAFVYCDPPYLISASEYNKLWNEDKECELYSVLDDLNRRGIRFGITNLVRHKGQENRILLEWAEKYKIFSISSNYISFNDNTIKEDSSEVYVTNYEKN